jgi:hypothetical protein
MRRLGIEKALKAMNMALGPAIAEGLDEGDHRACLDGLPVVQVKAAQQRNAIVIRVAIVGVADEPFPFYSYPRFGSGFLLDDELPLVAAKPRDWTWRGGLTDEQAAVLISSKTKALWASYRDGFVKQWRSAPREWLELGALAAARPDFRPWTVRWEMLPNRMAFPTNAQPTLHGTAEPEAFVLSMLGMAPVAARLLQGRDAEVDRLEALGREARSLIPPRPE